MDQLETESPGTSPLLPLALGAVNWLGLWTHCVKEVHRFFKVGFQTLMAPTVTTLLFLAIFTLAFGRRVPNLGGVTFAEFLAPGLIMMAIIQNAFANTSSSIMISKIQGNIVDVLMPPLTPGELAFGFIMGGVARGVLVALMVGGAMAVFVPIHIGHIGLIVFHTLAASIMLSILGLLAGIWADKFDQVASITNFIVTPLSFLSGTFYSIDRLPPVWRGLAEFNPFFYLIDGFRYGFIGHADGSLLVGVAAITIANVVLWAWCYWMFRTGYKLKS